MWSSRIVAIVSAGAVAAGLVAGTRVTAQDHGVTPADIERGGQMFLASCATCHGLDGDGVAGANLTTGTFRRGTTDQELINIIRNGIPGTAMPPSNLPEAQAALIVAYLRSIPGSIASSKTTGLRGDPVNGKAVFDGKGGCASCHRVQGNGGFLGPDLSSAGITRRSIELERALTHPNADIRTGTRTATVINKDGTTILGRLLNQDTYSLQLIDAKGKLWSFHKDAVRKWDISDLSAMPSFADKLTTQELADVVSYLGTLKVPVQAAPARGRGGAPAPAPAGGRGVL
jgi:putative heme-binding domain-containing protein